MSLKISTLKTKKIFSIKNNRKKNIQYLVFPTQLYSLKNYYFHKFTSTIP